LTSFSTFLEDIQKLISCCFFLFRIENNIILFYFLIFISNIICLFHIYMQLWINIDVCGATVVPYFIILCSSCALIFINIDAGNYDNLLTYGNYHNYHNFIS
jgi:hypothetical protein